ncbi:MAG: serine hydrolase, partial [Bacteroidetes bacterium]|nr:serine hydrolase [Bacteroidota bacterium]
NDRPVRNEDIYDLASVTKIAASVPCLMRLYEADSIDLDAKMVKYLPYLDSTNKQDITVKEVLTHQAGLTPWIPFWIKTVKDTALYRKLYSTGYDNAHTWKVAENLYIDSTYSDSILRRIVEYEQLKKKEYKYSDIGYYLFQDIIERMTGERLDRYAGQNFYMPLGAYTLGYLPLLKFQKDRIVPTENDVRFRNQLIHGWVHDPGAAMMGGVAGHAGVFSNANDLAKLMQMYLNGGEYGGVRYFKKSTLEVFTSCPYCKKGNRRGVGFDKPEMDYNKAGPTCKCISGKSFGHTGFTGTMAWADPEEQVVFIFLSNRIHPDEENKKLIKSDVRSNIMEALYKAIAEGKEE